jgi:hypothetical protein
MLDDIDIVAHEENVRIMYSVCSFWVMNLSLQSSVRCMYVGY